MGDNSGLYQHSMEIADARDVVSVELVQHEKVKLILESSNARDTISTELLQSGCSGDLPCTTLEHSISHSDSQSFLTFTVHSASSGPSVFILVSWMLIFGITSLLFIWMIRKWMKRKLVTGDYEEEVEGDVPRVTNHRSKVGDKVEANSTNEKISVDKACSQSIYDDSTGSLFKPVNNNNNNNSPIMSTKDKAHTRRLWPLYMTVFTLACCIALVIVGGDRKRGHNDDLPVLRISFPSQKHIRHIRSYSSDPSLEDVQMGTESSAVLVTRLQLLDLSPDCRNNLTDCRVHALCDSHSGAGSVQCRCNRGYYLKELTCIPCSTSCEEGFYMTQQCGASNDVVCKPCTMCGGTTYEVATCTSTQDSICIDVTFPLKQYQDRITSVEEQVSLNASMSKNVFLEKLQGIKEFHSSLYMSTNKQALGFVWFRPESGLNIQVKVTELYLIPQYVDIDYIDDKNFLDSRINTAPPEKMNQIRRVRAHNCRHPLPDEYDLKMTVGHDKMRQAYEYTCDSHNERLPACPSGYVDGDKYTYHMLKRDCPQAPDNDDTFKTAYYSTLCMGDTEMASAIFRKSFDKPTDVRERSKECEIYERQCKACLSEYACPASRTINETDCCNKRCHARRGCQVFYSSSCPETPVECSRGDILKFGIMPRFPHIEDQFACHLRHLPPKHLYKVTYEASIDTMNFTFGKRVKQVLYKNFSDLLDGHDEVDFLTMNHITESRYDDEVILQGMFKNGNTRKVQNYSLHKLKDFHQFERSRYQVVNSMDTYQTQIQFVRPFLYSTETWSQGGCDKNLSQIVPSQPIFERYGRQVEKPEKSKNNENGSFVYSILSQNAMPHIRFYIPENTSILSYYRDSFADSKINPGSLKGEIIWNTVNQVWNISLQGSVSSCPGLFTVEIFLENLLTRLSVYDMLVTCPQNFSTDFLLRRNFVQMADIFIVVLNDTATSHRLVLTSVQGPQLFSAVEGKSAAMKVEEGSPWLPMIVILTVCSCLSLLLLMIYMYCSRQKTERIPTDIRVPKPDLGPRITLLQNIDKGGDKRLSMTAKCIMMVLVVLYIAYALVFTFTALFALFHVIQGSSLSGITTATNVSSQIQSQMQQSLNTVADYEDKELQKMFVSTERRLQACSSHLKLTLNKSVPNVNAKLLNILKDMFEHSGVVQQKLGDYFSKRHKVYQKEIDKYLSEFNETCDKNLHRVQIAYESYLKSVADNKWLEFPLEVFRKQQVLDGHPTEKLTDYLADFLAWLEIDKVHEIFEIKEIVVNRVRAMMPKIDFSRLLDEKEDLKHNQAFADMELKPAANIFKFSYTKQKSRLRSYNLFSEYDEQEDPVYTAETDENILSNIRGIIYPMFIGVFLLLDIFLLVYRFTWMLNSLKVFKTGIEDRVPYNAITKTIHFILTGRDVPLPEDSWDEPYNHYNMMFSKKGDFWDDRRLYFLYCQANQKERVEILREQLLLKQRQNPRPVVPPQKKEGCFEKYGFKILKTMYKVYHSAVFWRLILICGFVLILCLVAKATNDLVTMESAMFLLDTEAMLPILERQNDITNNIILSYGDYLNSFLTGYKRNLDTEVAAINHILVTAAENQTLLLNTVISELCNLAGTDHCGGSVDLVTLSLTSCNFMPVPVHPLTGFQSSAFVESIQNKVSPLVTNLRSILFGTLYLLLMWASAMILCQITARVIFVHLKKSPHLKRTKIYQLPSQCTDWSEQTPFQEKEMFENHSVIAESCESGVYDMTN